MANARWVGGAPVVRQTSTATVALTWTAGDTARLTIGTKDMILTIGAAVTVTDVANNLVAAFNSSSGIPGTFGSGYSVNIPGQDIAEFAGLFASNVAGVVTILGLSNGEPFTLTAGEVTASTGTLTAGAGVTGTGPNHINNPDNWAAGTLPVAADVLYFDFGDIDALHGLDYFRTNAIACPVVITNDWTGQLGLGLTNPNGYPEYRTRAFRVNGASLQLTAGVNGTTEAKPVYLDFQSQTSTISIAAARNLDTGSPSVFISGGDPSILEIKAGNVVVESDDSEATGGGLIELETVTIGLIGQSNSECIVKFGSRTTWAPGALTVYSGLTTFDCAVALAAAGVLYGGVTRLNGPSVSSTFSGFSVYKDATLMPIRGTSCASVEVLAGGSLDCREAVAPWVLSTGATIHAGAKVFDPAGNFFFTTESAELKLLSGSLNDITHELPAGRVWYASAPA